MRKKSVLGCIISKGLITKFDFRPPSHPPAVNSEKSWTISTRPLSICLSPSDASAMSKSLRSWDGLSFYIAHFGNDNWSIGFPSSSTRKSLCMLILFLNPGRTTYMGQIMAYEMGTEPDPDVATRTGEFAMLIYSIGLSYQCLPNSILMGCSGCYCWDHLTPPRRPRSPLDGT